MNWLDLLLISLTGISFLLGYKDGFIKKLVGVIGFFSAIILGIYLAGPLSVVVMALFDSDRNTARIIAGFLVFVVVSFAASLLKKKLKPDDKVNSLINNIAGGIVGSLQTLFFLSAILYISGLLGFPGKEVKNESLFYKRVYYLLPQTVNLFVKYSPSAKEKIEKIIQDKDSSGVTK